MSTKRDIEVVMQEIRDTMVSKLPDAITAMNTEKGDTLLPTFDTESYFLYRLGSVDLMPNYLVSFLQHFESTDVVSITSSTAINYRVAINVVIRITNDGLSDIRLTRYMRILRDIIDKHVTPCYSGSRIENVDYIQGDDSQKNLYLIGQFIIGVFKI